jgi:hypothetical protein
MIKYEEMTNRQKAYWISLMMAIDTIDEHCENKNLDLEDIEVKQTAIKHFIAETHVKVEEDLNHMDELENKRHKKYTLGTLLPQLAKKINA